MILSKILSVSMLFAFIMASSGCAGYMAKNGDMAQYDAVGRNFQDGVSRATVEKDFGAPTRSEEQYDEFLKTTIYLDTYQIKYKKPNPVRSDLWFTLALTTLGLTEVLATPIEFFGFYESVERNLVFIKDRVAGRQYAYYTLGHLVTHNPNIMKQVNIVLLPFTGNADKHILESLRYQFSVFLSYITPKVKLVDRSRMDSILNEHQFNMTMTDMDNSINLGKLAGADYMISVHCLQKGDNYFDASATLINVETGSIEGTSAGVIW